MRIVMRIICAIALLLGIGMYTYGEVDATPSAEFLNHVSQIILVGVATPDPTTAGSINIQVSRVLKGQELLHSNTLTLGGIRTTGECGIPPNTQPVTAIWFLSSSPSGALIFAQSPRSQSCHPFANDFEVQAGPLASKWQYPDSTPAKDKLAYELAASIEANNGNGPYALILNAQLLKGVSKEIGTDIYGKLAADGSESLHFLGLLGLVQLADAPSVQNLASNVSILEQTKARTFLMKNGKQVPITYGAEQSNGSTRAPEIAQSVFSLKSTDDRVVNALGRILQDAKTLQIKYAAAQALQNIHTPLAVSFLAPLLSSEDRQLRSFAVGGLSCFANGVAVVDLSVPGGGISLSNNGPFKTTDTVAHFAMGEMTISKHPDYYLSYWKSWWADNAASVQAQSN
jgi:hypothetical protein